MRCEGVWRSLLAVGVSLVPLVQQLLRASLFLCSGCSLGAHTWCWIHTSTNTAAHQLTAASSHPQAAGLLAGCACCLVSDCETWMAGCMLGL
jgi:hypothetical protein